jgi:peptidyl-prolyl cis-trans isomerase A (cyclophilin A)
MSRNYYSFLFLTCWFAVTGCGISSTSNPEQRVESSKSNAPVSSVSENFRVKFETSKGDFIVEVNPEWAPRGAKRFQELVNSGFFDECRFFRVLDSFMAQFGINGDPNVQKKWGERSIPDDRVTQSNQRGFLSFATRGPNTRTSQMFINLVNNARLDRMGFSPFGKVVEGMEVVDKLYNGYGEGFPGGSGPKQGQIQSEGNAYLKKDFPKLDYINKATLIEN